MNIKEKTLKVKQEFYMTNICAWINHETMADRACLNIFLRTLQQQQHVVVNTVDNQLHESKTSIISSVIINAKHKPELADQVHAHMSIHNTCTSIIHANLYSHIVPSFPVSLC